ncbi:unnamed protein product [Cylicocyclus nassatus]|uniref:Uncharacterized protein n=1 Tax=Cylicocyclus nassatus TaxID=53992 RepID=A0AA36M4Y4_CYLNA|nr:unnamed protein product [Cylicocyclus nassatus]
MDSRPLLLATIIHFVVKACPPQQGTCYSGSASLSSRYGGNIVNRRCADTANRDWCAVSYYPHTDIANFGCANEFTLPFGSATCGDGAGSINQQGCSMVRPCEI